MTTTTGTNGRCDPQKDGCKALSDAKNTLRQERSDHLKELHKKIDSLKTMIVTMLVSMVLLLATSAINLAIKLVAE